MTHRIRLFALILYILGMPAYAQETLATSSEAEAVFQRGVDFFVAGQFVDAVTEFDRVLADFPPNQRTTAAYLMKGKAHLRLDELIEADKALKTFLLRFPTSNYVPDAEYTLGLTYINIGRYEDAADLLRSAWQRKGSANLAPALERNILRALDLSIDRYFTIPMLRQLVHTTAQPTERMFFLLKLAEKQFAARNITLASETLDSLKLQYPHHPYGERVAGLQLGIDELGTVRLGALLPLMRNSEPSALKEIGNDVYDGVLFAVEEHQKNPAARVKIFLETRDTERDPHIARQRARELVENKDIIGIIGPVFSHVASAIAGFVDSSGVSLITPTANQNGIAAAGPCIFQGNPDYETRGRAMGRFAVQIRGLKTFGILAPSDTYGRFMADAFAREVMRLGAKIVTTERYQRGTADLKMQLFNIRKAGMLEGAEPVLSFAGKLNHGDIAKLIRLGVNPKTLDSLIEGGKTIGAKELLGPHAKAKIDSLDISATYSDPQIDSIDYPVTALDGIYIPISSPSEVGVISPQLVYFNFRTQILGSGEWNNLAELDANKRYCKGVIFESDYYVREDSPSYVRFHNDFYERFKKWPSKNTLYGYDAATLVLALVRNGAVSRSALRGALSNVRDFQGLHTKIGLAQSRVNSWLSIMQYNSNIVEKIGEVDVDERFDLEGAGELGRR